MTFQVDLRGGRRAWAAVSLELGGVPRTLALRGWMSAALAGAGAVVAALVPRRYPVPRVSRPAPRRPDGAADGGAIRVRGPHRHLEHATRPADQPRPARSPEVGNKRPRPSGPQRAARVAGGGDRPPSRARAITGGKPSSAGRRSSDQPRAAIGHRRLAPAPRGPRWTAGGSRRLRQFWGDSERQPRRGASAARQRRAGGGGAQGAGEAGPAGRDRTGHRVGPGCGRAPGGRRTGAGSSPGGPCANQRSNISPN